MKTFHVSLLGLLASVCLATTSFGWQKQFASSCKLDVDAIARIGKIDVSHSAGLVLSPDDQWSLIAFVSKIDEERRAITCDVAVPMQFMAFIESKGEEGAARARSYIVKKTLCPKPLPSLPWPKSVTIPLSKDVIVKTDQDKEDNKGLKAGFLGKPGTQVTLQLKVEDGEFRVTGIRCALDANHDWLVQQMLLEFGNNKGAHDRIRANRERAKKRDADKQ